MSTLTDFLHDRINQLSARRNTINENASKKDVLKGKGFRMEDLPKIEKDIEETKWALAGIDQWIKIAKHKANKIPQTAEKYSAKQTKNIPDA